MKKSYCITYKTNKANVNNESLIKQKLEAIGSCEEVLHYPRALVYFLVPDKEGFGAREIVSDIRSVLNPFDDMLMVVGIRNDDCAKTDNWCDSIIEKCDKFEGDEKRNFSRFNSRHEAFMAYQRERPKWVYQDGIGAAIAVDFNEWCWLPIRKDGIYEKNGKYDKYLNN